MKAVTGEVSERDNRRIGNRSRVGHNGIRLSIRCLQVLYPTSMKRTVISTTLLELLAAATGTQFIAAYLGLPPLYGSLLPL